MTNGTKTQQKQTTTYENTHTHTHTHASEGRQPWRYVGMVGIPTNTTESPKSGCYVPILCKSFIFGDVFWQQSKGMRRHLSTAGPCLAALEPREALRTFRRVRVHHRTHLLACFLGRADALLLHVRMREMAITATNALDTRKLKLEDAWKAPPGGVGDRAH